MTSISHYTLPLVHELQFIKDVTYKVRIRCGETIYHIAQSRHESKALKFYNKWRTSDPECLASMFASIKRTHVKQQWESWPPVPRHLIKKSYYLEFPHNGER